MTMVEVDLEAIYALDAFEVFLEPTYQGLGVLPEQVAQIVNHNGQSAAQASWDLRRTVTIDGCKARVGESSRIIPLPRPEICRPPRTRVVSLRVALDKLPLT